MTRVGSVAARVVPVVVAVVVLVAVWQLVAVHDRYVLPHPLAVWDQLTGHRATYERGAGDTLEEAMAGLGVGFGAALVLAIVMTEIRVLARALLPLAVLANVTPVVALAPALVAAFGFGIAPKLAVTALICFFPVLINAIAGLRSVDPLQLEVLAVLHASRREILWRARLPASLPQLFVALRIVLPLSVIGAVVSEFVTPGSTRGLGTVIYLASQNAALDQVYAAVVSLGVVGVALSGIVALVARQVLAPRSV